MRLLEDNNQRGELTGFGFSDPWRIDFGNWQVDYSMY